MKEMNTKHVQIKSDNERTWRRRWRQRRRQQSTPNRGWMVLTLISNSRTEDFASIHSVDHNNSSTTTIDETPFGLICFSSAILFRFFFLVFGLGARVLGARVWVCRGRECVFDLINRIWKPHLPADEERSIYHHPRCCAPHTHTRLKWNWFLFVFLALIFTTRTRVTTMNDCKAMTIHRNCSKCSSIAAL